MSNKERRTGELVSRKTTIFYSFAGIADTMSYQMFTFYIFNFYFTVIIGDIWLVTIGYIIWSIWNAINDPLLGILSDRTSTRWGRRKPHIIAGIIPTCILIVLLWMAPVDNPALGFLYFLIVINLFDTFYTAYSLNQTSLFPEMFQDLDQRVKANSYVAIFNIIGLLFAALLPTFFFTELLGYGTPAERATTQIGYITASIVMSILAAVFAAIFVIFGIKERKEYSKDPEQAPPFFKSI
ncbi:MAG: MFS transporter, partial [Candidatus Thorarchaeota archaeon]